MTTEEITRLAKAINALRADWPIGSLIAFITDKLAHRILLDAAIPLVWVALDSDTRTPGRCLEAGPWGDALRSAIFPTKPTPIPEFDFQALHRARAHRMPSEDAKPIIAAARSALRKSRAAAQAQPEQETA